ncbi:tyrosine-protein phosphatase [Arthrobacter gandavensis]|uniref:tyrosine-protein phosphatase n=1 Tax=Arthrobacter gandavensis TaxID=169960 RepID=UPI00188EAC25|nr:tyrosine-protein phosphatase [Arthrobacter gandavensis]MBF4992828.1 tyrosine-protein phosphatase [Arthrobacter gandavensis]
MVIHNLEGTFNFRDIGGLPLTGGGTTASGVLYRSDAISSLTPKGLADLAGSGIRVIIDYRTPAEQQMAPARGPAAREVEKMDLPLIEGAFTGMAEEAMQRAAASGDPAAAMKLMEAAMERLPTLGQLYIGMLEHGAAEFARTAGEIAAGEGAVLIHCTAGKDRTGVAAALILDAAGADRKAVVGDYGRSEANLAGEWSQRMLGMVGSMGVPLTEGIVTLITRAPAEAIQSALAWVEETYGSAAGYLRAGGLTDPELSRLRARLQQPHIRA